MTQVLLLRETDGIVGEEDDRVVPSEALDRVIHVDPKLHTGSGGEAGPGRAEFNRGQRAILPESCEDGPGRSGVGVGHGGKEAN
jgi:hypothetical protein